jgi:hypothetical protein
VATRTVRLDSEAEAALRQITEATGLPISQALKRGLRALQAEVARESARQPFDVYKTLDLGPGGYAIAQSTDVGAGVRKALRRKLGR